MKIYIGADHRGFRLKQDLVDYLHRAAYEVEDEGDSELSPEDDYPQFAGRVCSKILSSNDPDTRGILLCGSGQGMCMAANRFKGIRAALGFNRQSARVSRNDDDSNVLCIPTDILGKNEIYRIVDIWLKTAFAAAPRYIRRNQELDELG